MTRGSEGLAGVVAAFSSVGGGSVLFSSAVLIGGGLVFRARAALRDRCAAQVTNRAKSRSSSSAGSAHSPVCTGPGCTIVLAGATSQ